MTKINKLGKSTFVIAILSFILVAVLAFGGTYAYFSASDSLTAAPVKTGILRLDLTNGTDDKAALTITDTLVVPNQQIINDTITLDDGATNIPYYARAKYSVSVTLSDNVNKDEDENPVHDTGCAENITEHLDILNIVYDGEWMQAGTSGVYYYVGTLTPEEGVTPTSADTNAAVVQPDANLQYTVQITVKDVVGAGECTYYQDATITITLSFEVVQAEYLDSSTTPTSDRTVDALHTLWNQKVGA